MSISLLPLKTSTLRMFPVVASDYIHTSYEQFAGLFGGEKKKKKTFNVASLSLEFDWRRSHLDNEPH